MYLLFAPEGLPRLACPLRLAQQRNPDAPTDNLAKEKVGCSGDNVDIVLALRKGQSKACIRVESDYDL